MYWIKEPPQESGWHWFLPDKDWDPPIPGLLLRQVRPVVMLVGTDRVSNELCIRLHAGDIMVKDMIGLWSIRIRTPRHHK